MALERQSQSSVARSASLGSFQDAEGSQERSGVHKSYSFPPLGANSSSPSSSPSSRPRGVLKATCYHQYRPDLLPLSFIPEVGRGHRAGALANAYAGSQGQPKHDTTFSSVRWVGRAACMRPLAHVVHAEGPCLCCCLFRASRPHGCALQWSAIKSPSLHAAPPAHHCKRMSVLAKDCYGLRPTWRAAGLACRWTHHGAPPHPSGLRLRPGCPATRSVCLAALLQHTAAALHLCR
jgi:hypothetical protein